MKTKNILLTALFAALTAAGAFVRVPMWPSPLTMQLLVTFIAGLVLGPRWGALSQIVYLALGLCGLPVFTEGGGLGYIFRPTFGFLLAMPLTALVAGALYSRGKRGFLRGALCCAAGSVVLYAVGLPYMYLILNLYLGIEMGVWQAVFSGMVIFLPGDALKCAAAAWLAVRLRPVLEVQIHNAD